MTGQRKTGRNAPWMQFRLSQGRNSLSLPMCLSTHTLSPPNKFWFHYSLSLWEFFSAEPKDQRLVTDHWPSGLDLVLSPPWSNFNLWLLTEAMLQAAAGQGHLRSTWRASTGPYPASHRPSFNSRKIHTFSVSASLHMLSLEGSIFYYYPWELPLTLETHLHACIFLMHTPDNMSLCPIFCLPASCCFHTQPLSQPCNKAKHHEGRQYISSGLNTLPSNLRLPQYKHSTDTTSLRSTDSSPVFYLPCTQRTVTVRKQNKCSLNCCSVF